MESLLFALDLFLMVCLVWAVFRAERKAPQFRDLGLFSYRDLGRPPTAEPLAGDNKDGPHA